MSKRKQTEPEKIVEAPKPWCLTQADIDSITDAEFTRGTTRLLPPENEIPIEFYGPLKGQQPNIYYLIADAMYVGDDPPPGDIAFNTGFTGENVLRMLTAHLRSFDPEYEHKIAALAYMIATVMTIKTETNSK